MVCNEISPKKSSYRESYFEREMILAF